MNQNILEKYARLILTLGVNLQEGQNVLIQTEPIHWEFVNILSRLAYQMGAKYLRANIDHPEFSKARVDLQKPQYLEYVPAFYDKYVNVVADEGWANIFIGGQENPELYRDVDQSRYAKMRKAMVEAAKPLTRARLAGNCAWNISNLPTPQWAASVLGSEPSQESLIKLWEIMIPILRLDQEDPISFWRSYSKVIKKRVRTLNEMKLSSVTFRGPGTNLRTQLAKESIWVGASDRTKDGSEFFPNFPTEEVTTTPDFRKTEGHVRTTRPVMVMDQIVEGAWFEFKDGGVVDFGADKNKIALEIYFEIDRQNAFLGEVALVDISSPIFQSGKIFNNILYDENATCHIALGRGFAMCMHNGKNLSDEELKEIGCNSALMHVDFMIGSDKVSVIGQGPTGEEAMIMDKGRFVI